MPIQTVYDIIKREPPSKYRATQSRETRTTLLAQVLPYKIETEKREDGSGEEDVHVLFTAKKNQRLSQQKLNFDTKASHKSGPRPNIVDNGNVQPTSSSQSTQ